MAPAMRNTHRITLLWDPAPGSFFDHPPLTIFLDSALAFLAVEPCCGLVTRTL